MTNRPTASGMDRIVGATVYAAVLLSLAAGGAITLWRPEVDRWIANNVAEVGGPFDSSTRTDKAFTRADLLGHPHVVYFGFTSAPIFAPRCSLSLPASCTTWATRQRRSRSSSSPSTRSATRSPVMRDYLSAFDDSFIGLTGSPEAIAAAAKAYRIYYRRIDFDDGTYTMDHTAAAMLFNADGSYAEFHCLQRGHGERRGEDREAD